MIESEARDWLANRYSTAIIGQLERFAGLLEAAADAQSLIARSTVPAIWSRHIVDSAQLVSLAPHDGPWLDIGSGAGLPGLVVAILRDAPTILCEPRRKRVDFLNEVIAVLGLTNASVEPAKVQNLATPVMRVISARAVASIEQLFAWTGRIVSRETLFLLPRGRSWASELEIARHAWHGAFHVEQSLTDSASGIVTASGVTKR